MKTCMDCEATIPDTSVLCESCSRTELLALLGADADREYRDVDRYEADIERNERYWREEQWRRREEKGWP